MQVHFRTTRRQIRNKQRLGYWLSFLIPLLTVIVYFSFQKNFPFGNGSVLTTDLGQEYIDFFSYYRRVLLGHPEQFLYSFSSSLGGSMLGTWSYYLMSPFNLVLLLTPGKWITVGIWLITALKLGCCGLTMYHLLNQRQQLAPQFKLALSIAYALCGYCTAYQLNIMWLDCVYLLPLIILGIEQLVAHSHFGLYCGALALSLLTNYYIAYMICLFSVLYFTYLLIIKSTPQLFKKIGYFIFSSGLAAALNAWLLIPTYLELKATKTTYNAQKLFWTTEYNPVKLLGKLSIGSYSFDQMSSGEANIFVGTSLIILMLLFFLAKQFSWIHRLSTGIVTIFLIASFFIEPLDLLWHGGQFPVWYPSRFSFIFCAWIILIAAQMLAHVKKIPLWHFIVTGILLITWLGYLYLNIAQIDYLTVSNLVLTSVFAIVDFILLLFLFTDYHNRLLIPTLALVITAEVLVNYTMSLNQISYTKQSEYWSYTATINKTLTNTDATKNNVQRLEKTFNRTNDDPLQFGFAGGSQFNSMQNPIIGKFYDKIGQAAGDNYVAYRYGTQVTDSFLGFGTWLDSQDTFSESLQSLPNLDAGLSVSSLRPDVQNYQLVKRDGVVSIRKNTNALNLIFAANKQIKKAKLGISQPVLNQETLVNALLGQTAYQPLYSLVNFDSTVLKNVKSSLPTETSIYTRQDNALPATITYSFTPTTNDAYYLSLGSNLTSDQISITVDDVKVPIDENFRDAILLNIARNERNKKINIVITFKESQIRLDNTNLYRLDQTQLNQDFESLKAGNATLTTAQGNFLAGTITLKNNQLFMTTIPENSGWHLKVDGKSVNTIKVLDTFVAAKLTSGKHHFELTFYPDGWKIGWLLTAIAALVLLVIISYSIYRKRQHRQQIYHH